MVTVLLYGNSLALSSLGASLRGESGLRVMSFDPGPYPSPGDAYAVDADVVVFDMAAAVPDALAFWKASPDVLLIGLNMASDTALVLSPTTREVVTTHDLIQEIRCQVSVAPRPVRRRDGNPSAPGPRRYH